MNSIDLNAKAEEILAMAQKSGLAQNYFFITTFNRYQVQLSILKKLEEVIETEGTLVEKEYVKDKKNLYSHPAVAEYNKTSTSANQTVQTLLKIITTFESRTVGSDDEDEAL